MKDAFKHIILAHGLTIATGLISALATYIAINIKNLTKRLKKETDDNKQILVSALEVLSQLIYIIIFALQQKPVEELEQELKRVKDEIPSPSLKTKDNNDIMVEYIRSKVKEQISGEMEELLKKHLGNIDDYIDKQIRLQLKFNKII